MSERMASSASPGSRSSRSTISSYASSVRPSWRWRRDGDAVVNLPSHRREASDGPDSEVVAVGEPAGDDHRIDVLEIPVGVPQEHRLADVLGRLPRVYLVTGPGKPDDPELHGAAPGTASSTIS